VLERQCQRLSRFIDDLLEASRLRSGATILRIERIDVRGLVEELVEAFAPQATAKRQRLETRLPPEPTWIDADATRIQEVVSNLLANAVSYTGEGGLVSVTMIRGSGEVVVAVRDTGCGIPVDQLPYLFEMFSTGRGVPNHVGLGLAIAKDLVELHGGSIRAASRGPGRGSKFVVRLPEIAHRSPDASHVTGDASARRSDRALICLKGSAAMPPI
jgi:signal transduction histidine kinase